MQSNQSPEVSSNYSHLNGQHSTENGASSSSTKEPTSPSKAEAIQPATPSNSEGASHKRKLSSVKYSVGTHVAKQMKLLTNETVPKPTNSKDAKRSTNTGSEKRCTQISHSHYAALLNLTPDVDSIEEGKRLFEFLVGPLHGPNFMKNHWEKRPLRVTRNQPDFFHYLLTYDAVDKMLRKNHVEFTKIIDIQFNDGNETVTPIGRALPPTIWKYYGNGCGIKISNAQTFLPAIHSTNAALQEYFQCKIDSNIYMDSKNSEGHAPRYENAETFILRIEGSKHWCVHQPTDRKGLLPLESKSAVEIGNQVIDVTLEAGDVLYFPRGYIHETTTAAESHSLHVSIQLYRSQTYGDLLHILMPMALKDAIAEHVNLRKGLPLNIWQNMGVVHCDNYSKERDAAISQIIGCVETLARHVVTDVNMDNAVDQMGSRLQHDALPPKHRFHNENSTNSLECTANDSKRNETGIRVYYSSENPKEHLGNLENYMEIDPSDAPAIEVLIKAYPAFITPKDLQLDNDDKNLFVAQDLWERGMLTTDR